MSFEILPVGWPAQRRETVVKYLLTHSDPSCRTQGSIMRALNMSQATLMRLLSEMKGGGLLVEKPFGTAMVYELPYDVAVAKGLAREYEIFNVETFLAIHDQPNNGDWTRKVFNFGDVVYIYAQHRSGATLGIPVYDKNLKELIQGAALGLNIEAIIAAIIKYFQR
jgi:hypothetical protein